jgi:hypothetical protein
MCRKLDRPLCLGNRLQLCNLCALSPDRRRSSCRVLASDGTDWQEMTALLLLRPRRDATMA